MTEAEEFRFKTCYHRLCAAFQRKRDVNEYRVYLEALRPVPVAATEAAVLELSRTGGTWFPKAPELFALAHRYAEEIAAAERAARRQLPPDPELLAREMPGIIAAHRRFIDDQRAAGNEGLARFMENRTPRHPSEFVEADPVPRTVRAFGREHTRRDLDEGRTAGGMQPLIGGHAGG